MDTGILLTNLGTPVAPTPSSIRRYLHEFLSDPRVVEIPRWVWLPILYGFILPFRPYKTAKLYQKIWRHDGSPLRIFSERLAKNLMKSISAPVALGMRYGSPSIHDALESLRDKSKIIILPLYPQYCSATTGSTFDAITQVIQTWRKVPELHFINHYFDHPDYIQALADNIRAYRKNKKLLFSFHGIPKRSIDLGDPYAEQCHKTAQLIADNLELNTKEWQVVFQSRFGPAEWLQPYFSDVLKSLGNEPVDVVCPGFATDCLETLEEIALANKNINYIPALNDSSQHTGMLSTLLSAYL
ncbi:MAG: ferrochelatase [Gammaproteobacteria bacterium]